MLFTHVPYHFAPWIHFAPHIILPPIILPPGNLLMYTIFPFLYHHFAPISFCPPPPPPLIILPPWKLFHNLHYLPMSSIILPPWLILPPYHFCPTPLSFCPPPLEIVSWFTLFTHVQYHFAPWTHFAPISFCPLSFCPPENGLMIYTIYPCPVSFCPLH